MVSKEGREPVGSDGERLLNEIYAHSLDFIQKSVAVVCDGLLSVVGNQPVRGARISDRPE